MDRYIYSNLNVYYPEIIVNKYTSYDYHYHSNAFVTARITFCACFLVLEYDNKLRFDAHYRFKLIYSVILLDLNSFDSVEECTLTW